MKVYKFKDDIDGNYSFIIAKSKECAHTALKAKTSIQFTFIESKYVSDLKTPIFIHNKILPF